MQCIAVQLLGVTRNHNTAMPFVAIPPASSQEVLSAIRQNGVAFVSALLMLCDEPIRYLDCVGQQLTLRIDRGQSLPADIRASFQDQCEFSIIFYHEKQFSQSIGSIEVCVKKSLPEEVAERAELQKDEHEDLLYVFERCYVTQIL